MKFLNLIFIHASVFFSPLIAYQWWETSKEGMKSETELAVSVTNAWGDSHKERTPLFWFTVSTEYVPGPVFQPLWGCVEVKQHGGLKLWSNVAHLTKNGEQESNGGTYTLQSPSRIHHLPRVFYVQRFSYLLISHVLLVFQHMSFRGHIRYKPQLKSGLSELPSKHSLYCTHKVLKGEKIKYIQLIHKTRRMTLKVLKR